MNSYDIDNGLKNKVEYNLHQNRINQKYLTMR